jgi:hypothetical protein
MSRTEEAKASDESDLFIISGVCLIESQAVSVAESILESVRVLDSIS